mmetsp:Transcript_22077/g.38137  ORF Transcript_22077/g.38137 Transcript_22077/m.38137 type:complete len:146 (-) Transcript_22077:251-688(-)
MSWQQYVDKGMIGVGCMYAGIFDHKGARWGTSKGFLISPAEAAALAKALSGSSKNLDPVYEKGVSVCGQKYVVAKADVIDEEGWPPFIIGVCKEKGKQGQKLIVVWTEKALIVGVADEKYSKGRSIGQIFVDVGKLADYVISVGY